MILRWDEQLLSTIRAYPAQTGPTITARALGVLHTATYDAWAAYDPVAKVTRPDGPAQQASGRINEANKKWRSATPPPGCSTTCSPSPGLFQGATTPPRRSARSLASLYKTPDTVLASPGYPVNAGWVGNLAAKDVLTTARPRSATWPRRPS